MNELIKQLAEQAGWMMSDEVEGFNTRLEKFAALTAKECADLCDRFQARDVGMQPAECAEAIRKKFGLKS